MPREREAATTDQAPPVVAAPELDAGTRLGDRYRLVARLGRGGGGAVWRAFDEKVGEDVALKLIDTGADLERWRREVALARRISHPNVCRVYDLGEAGGRRWVTMERIEGESLRVLLARNEVRDRDAVMRQIIEAVAAIHAAGVVHRDLKPENIVVDRSGRAVIVDFGLARLPDSREVSDSGGGAPSPTISGNVTKHGTVLGTPRYMAPEQAAGQVADARSDVFALGLVLEEIARGEVVDDAMATTVSNESISENNGTPTVRVRAPLPRPWGPIVAKCAARIPADRYPDATAVRVALAPPRARARWLYVAGAGAVAAAASVAAVVMVAGGGESGEPAKAPAVRALRRLTSTASAPDTQPMSVALAPDGKTMAYTIGGQAFTRPVDGGTPTSIAMPTTAGGFPVARIALAFGITPEGRVLVQVLGRDDAWSVWAVGGDGPPQKLSESARRMNVAVSPHGDQLAIASIGAGLVVVSVAGGASRVVVAPRPGENIGGPSWSPDGAQLAFVRYAADWSGDTLEVVVLAPGAAPRVLVRGSFANPVDQMTAWTSADRIVYGLNRPGAGTLMAVKPSGGEPVELEHWTDEYVGQGSWAGGRLAFLRGTGAYAIQTGNVDRRGYILNLELAHPDSVQARRLVGWAADGRLIQSEDGDIVARAPRGPATVIVGGEADDIPDTIVDGTVLYHHAGASGQHAIGRVDVTTGTTRSLREVAVEPAATNLVRCAGDRTAPCVLEEVDGTSLRYVRFDPATGERDVIVHTMPLTGRYMRSFAVSPDGRRMALVDGSNQIVLIDLRDGTITREALAPSAELQSVTWSRGGESVIVTMLAGGDELFNVLRVTPGGERQLLLHSNRRWFWRVHESPAEQRVAVQTRELVLDIWLLDGI